MKKGMLPLMFGMGGLLNPGSSNKYKLVKTDMEGLKKAGQKQRKIEEAQPLSKRKIKQGLGKKNRKNRGRRRK